MKKNIKTIFSIILILIIFTGCGSKKKEDTDKNYNSNDKVIEEKVIEGLSIKNTSLVSTSNSATLITSVTNTTAIDKEVKMINIVIKDKEGKLLVTLQGYVGGSILAGLTREITSSVNMNLDNAYEIEYEISN